MISSLVELVPEPESAPDLGWVVAVAAVAVPALVSVVVALIQKDRALPRQLRRLAHVVDMLAKAPAGSASHAALDALAVSMIEPLRPVTTKRGRVRAAFVFWTVVFSAVSVVSLLLLSQWIVATAGTGWNVLAWIVTVIVGLALGLLVGAAVVATLNSRKVEGSEG